MKSKHLLLMLLMALMAPWAANAQTLNEGFENTTFPPADWEAIHVSGTNSWARTTSYHHGEGSASAYAHWASDGHENYLITPKLAPAADEALTFYVTAQSYAGTTLKVELSTTTPTAAAFTTVLATYTTGSSGTIGTTSTSTWVEKTIPATDLAAYVGQTIYIAFHVIDSNGGDVVIDDVTGVSLYVPSCIAPTELECTSTTTTTATLGWTERGTASEWQICLNGDETNLIAANSNPFTIDEEGVLVPGTTYTAKVRSSCSSSDQSDWTAEVSFTTECLATPALGYEEDFDDYEVPSNYTAPSTRVLPDCWRAINTTTYSSYMQLPSIYYYSSTNYANSTPNCLKFYSSYSSWSNYDPQPQYAILPPMSGLAGKQITLQARGYNTSSTFKIGTMSNPTDASTFTLIMEQTGLTDAYQEFTYIVPANCTDSYLCIMIDAANSSRTTNGVFIDDIAIADGPTCFKPTDLSATEDQSDRSVLGWTDNNSSAPANGWTVYYKKTSDATYSRVPAPTNPFTLTGLTAASNYQYYVVANCAADDESDPSDVFSFTTDCGVLTIDADHIFTENFDSYSVTSAWTPSTRTLPLCWNAINASTNSTYKNYPSIYYYNSNPEYANTRPNCMRFYTNADAKDQYAILPQMEDISGSRIKLSARVYSTSYDATFHVGVMTDPTDATTFVEIDSKTPTTTNYEQYTISFQNYTGSGEYIAIKVEASTPSYRAVFIDDITVEPIPSCLEPNAPEYVAGSANVNSAKVTWTPNGNETSWDLYWSTSETTPNASTAPMAESVTMTNNEYTIGSLNSSTKYYVWVRAHCSATDQSPWSGPCSFTTACGARTITDAEPYSENFNSYTATTTSSTTATGYPDDELPLCWSFLNRSNSSSSYPQVFLSPASGYAVSGNCLFFKSSSGTPLYAILPEFTNDISTLQLTFTYRNEGTTTSNGTLYAGYMTDPTDASTFQVKYTCAQTTSLTSVGPLYFADAPAGSYIVFRYNGGTSNNYYLSIDDVEVALAPTCWQPQNLQVTEKTNESAVFTWERHAMGTETSWMLQYGTDDTFATYLGQVTVNTNPTYEIANGLTASTTYYVRVKPACDTEGTLWSEVLEFETEADCAAPTHLAVTANSETATGATITWNGRNDSYVVEYREVITPAVEFDETYDFEDGTLQGWTTISNDNDNIAWDVQTGANDAHNSTYYARSRYTSSSDGGDANDWLISPQIPLGGTLSFYAKKYTSGTDRFQVYVSTTDNNISDFTAISEVITPPTTYQLYEYDLSSYSGNGYVAIVYTAPNDQYYVFVDDIHITASIAGEYDAWQPVSDANPTSPYTFSTLDDNTTYEVRVKGICGSNESDYSDVVSFTTLEACPAPIDFTTGTVTTETAAISWNGGVATEWKVWIKESTETEYPSTFSTVNIASKTFDNLDDNTSYDVKIAPTCDETKYLEVEDAFTTLDACPAPTGFTLGTVTAHEASFSWTQPDNGVTINEWTVTYGEETVTVTGTPSATLENLTASTTYEVVIAPACNVEKTLVGSFTTECDVVTTFPWSESFNSLTVANSIPNCWNNEDGTTTDASQKWCYSTNTSGNGATNGTSHDDSKCVRFNSWSTTENSTNFLKTPTFNLPDSPMQLSFWYKNPTGGDFSVYISTDGGATYTTSLFTDLTGQSTWTKMTYDLTAYAGEENVVIVFGGTSNYANGDAYIYLDDVRIEEFVTFDVTGYGENTGGYVFIASPVVGDIAPSAVDNLVNAVPANYDLFSFNQAAEKQWVNSKNENNSGFVLSNGYGYLYASQEDVTLTFTGVMETVSPKEVQLQFEDNAEFEGLNLVGNPFPVAATVDRPYYKMNAAGTNLEAVENDAAVPACTGIMVWAENGDDKVIFTKVQPSSAPNNGKLNIAVAKANLRGNGIQDNVIVSFNQGSRLGKYVFNANNAKLFIHQDGKDYAVVSAEAQGEMPVSFKAVENGSYTLSFNAVGTEFSYLHLIDNLTGNDVDLLASPSYSFDACASDYASRFRLVFAKADANSDNFAFISNGEIILAGVNGNSTVQMFDVTGRMINSFNGNSHFAISDMAAGVYMIRLINGDDVKTQKIVVR